jgi:hypothetical protein
MKFFVHIGEKYHQAKNCFNASCQVPSPTDHPFQIKKKQSPPDLGPLRVKVRKT